MISSPPPRNSNFAPLLWHAAFLALASNFMDVDTIIPSMLIKAGGNEIHLGFMTAIMLGGSSLFQLFFAGLISHKPRKKNFLLWGINLRIIALFALAILFFYSDSLAQGLLILFIFVFISQFSFSGAFANISYVDIVGKSIKGPARKTFFSAKQVVFSAGVFVSALVARELLVMLDFPNNYAFLFALAAALLFVASLGFWRLKEEPTQTAEKKTLLKFLTMIPAEVKNNKNLKYYLLLINSLGLGLSTLPFIIYLAKESFGLSYSLIGNFLLLKTLGMLGASLLLLKFARRFKYKYLLMISLILAASMPIASLLFRDSTLAYQSIFVFAGIFMATYKTAIEGILLEISTDENRAIYTGISGAGNILTTIFPLVAGVLILILGYTPVFIAVSLLILSSFYFVLRIDCSTKLQK
ncbi:MAG: MFS transporter [Deltaproteobacteria bacterium]|nr:MFS transporter [Deltaproteobacteria bacterium]